MPIPLYFVTNCKECVKFPGSISIPPGCGINAAGELRAARDFQSNGPLLLDDAYTVLPTENCLKKLFNLCQNGCILDFERSAGEFHRHIIRQMAAWHIAPLWLPERFAPYAPTAFVTISQTLPHNSWRQFCQSIQQRYPNRWCLELQPVNWEKKLAVPQKIRDVYLEEAACMCKICAGTVRYYDTKQSLLKKLRIAEDCGCRGAIALWSEWQNL